jgi:hypothetical protein
MSTNETQSPVTASTTHNGLRGAAERLPGGAGQPPAAPAKFPRQRVTSATTRNFPQLRFFILDREWHRRLRRATQAATVAALHKERDARRLCITHGYCVAYYTHDRKFFTWHFYPSKADVLAHVEYLNFAFRAYGGCPRVAKLRVRGRSWTAAEKLAFERRAYGV